MIQEAPTAGAAVTPDEYRRVISGLPTGITVITTRSVDGPVGCTANAVMSLSAQVPSLLVSLATGSRTLARILAAGTFAVNVLAFSDHALVRRFATGTAAERFADVPWGPVHGVPVLTGSVVGVVCTVAETATLLDHTLLVGTVTWARSDDRAPSVLCRNQQYAVGG